MRISLAAIPFPTLDPVLFQVGPLAIRWYGLAYLLGFGLAYVALTRFQRNGSLRVAAGSVSDLIAWASLGAIVGGRVGWWVFYQRDEGVGTAWYEPFAIWHGGMSFHGGLAGVAVAIGWWSRRNRVAFWNVADGVALVAPGGLFFGRIANFVNAELVGRQTQVPWGVVFPGESLARHPSQLYEAMLEGPILFACLWLLRHSGASRADGMTASWLLVLYGGVRIAVEFTRQPDEQLGFVALGWVTMGQMLSLAMIFAGAAIFALRATSALSPQVHALSEKSVS